ncbi:hypothetical protein GCM10009127_29090 [Alteraurantiacibacter aestuarii]|uniref:Phage shock protein B n=1 Tax=Alteraurantiacibacter aestuarii TaxID=650004 RepID=A0A844ZTX7_9SPHN|nr:hypothetical protein [Alteraurantiacibacter aestuarii]MXO89019.1 hypothetical protein [Alteraurantiacibacter aestuarii]
MGNLALLIPIMGMSIPLFAIWMKHREKVEQMRMSATAENTAERAAQYASHVQELEQRVRVLERIVTDQGYDTARQIEALRDNRQVENRRLQAENAAI